MRFITFGYLFFFILVFLFYWLIPNRKIKLWIIAISSSLFYASWSIPFLIHFATFVILNYFLALSIRNDINQKTKKIKLVISLVLNLSNLIFFKYFYLLLKIFYDITQFEIFKKEFFDSLLANSFGQTNIVLPLAISFYTFQMLAYLIDTYYDKIKRNNTLLEFYIFILFFPQLVAGPIMRHNDFFYQYDQEPKLTIEYIIKGFYLIFIGLIKKVLIADNIALIIEPVFDNPLQYNGFTNFLAGIGYAIRVYGDFSGYTDIARGSAYLLGFSIPENFNGPFLSTTITEFWRRWHVTLSSWLRDYVYIPLGGSRTSNFRANMNLITTFTIGGLWHGANYTYIIWGLFYGILLVLEKPFINQLQNLLNQFKILKIFFIFYTFLLFSIGFLFFNARDITHSLWMFKQIIFFQEGKSFTKDQLIQIFSFLVIIFIFNFIQYYKNRLKINFVRDTILIYLLAILVIWLLGNYSPQTQSFIYFQF